MTEPNFVDVTNVVNQINSAPKAKETVSATAETKAPEGSEPPKKKRGRPLGSTKDKTSASSAENIRSGAIPNVQSNTGASPAPAPASEAAPAPAPVNTLMTGYLLLITLDLLAPLAVTFLLKKSKPELKAKNLKMTKQEREDLEPLADEAAKVIAQNINPVTMFFVMYSATLVTKAMAE